jgi:uncharacterized protein (DUF1330 family)
MKQKLGLVFALLVGIAIGAWGIAPLNAQNAAPQTYIIAEMRVTDPAGFTEYMRREPPVLAQYHGRVVARGLPQAREGAQPDGTVSLYAFNTPQDADRWYDSPEYRPLRDLRQRTAKSDIWFLTGVLAQ